MKKKSEKLGSFIVSLLFGAFVGFYASSLFGVTDLLSNTFKLSVGTITVAFVVLGVLIIGYFGNRNPRTTELFAFLFSAFIFLQILWDGGAEPVFGKWRTFMSFAGLGLFLLNSFTGYLRIGSGLKALRRAMGGR